jgi:ATP synthase protein I
VSKQVIRAIRSRSYWLAGLQFIVITIASVVALVVSNKGVAFSIFLGGLVSVIPNIYFAKRLFQNTYARSAKKIVVTFYINEVIKLFLISLLFIAVIKLHFAEKFPLVVGFVLAQICVLFLPLIYSLDNIFTGKKLGQKRVR